VYNQKTDGNVFHWILESSQDFRQSRARERYVKLEELANTHKAMEEEMKAKVKK
jgi:hypothetical protein